MEITNSKMSDKEHVSKEQFDHFLNNDFAHLTLDVKKLLAGFNFIKGAMWVIVPILLLILGIVVRYNFVVE